MLRLDSVEVPPTTGGMEAVSPICTASYPKVEKRGGGGTPSTPLRFDPAPATDGVFDFERNNEAVPNNDSLQQQIKTLH